MTDTPTTINLYGIEPSDMPQEHADLVAQTLGLRGAERWDCGHDYGWWMPQGKLIVTRLRQDAKHANVRCVTTSELVELLFTEGARLRAEAADLLDLLDRVVSEVGRTITPGLRDAIDAAVKAARTPEGADERPRLRAEGGRPEYVLALLVAGGYVTQAKVDQARAIALGVSAGPMPAADHEMSRLRTEVEALRKHLRYAEAALADIGDAEREPGDDLAWCERRAADALPRVRAAIRDSRTQNATVDVPGQAAEIARLRAEVEALRGDAERYRFLRGDEGPPSIRWSRWQIAHWKSYWDPVQGIEMDAAVDASRKAIGAARTPEVQP